MGRGVSASALDASALDAVKSVNPAELAQVDSAELLHAVPSGPLPRPLRAHDWLAKIGLVPIIERGASWDGPPIKALGDAAAAFFASPVRVLEAASVAPLDGGKFGCGKWQLHVDPLLSKLTGLFDSAANADLFCLVGITLADLYSSPSDLFVAGMAAGGSGVAIFSFARYHPHVALSETHWWDYGERFGPGERSGCLYGLDHCVFHRCVMQGSGHLLEDYEAPMQLCRVCLSKLCFRLGFDLAQRATQLDFALTDGGCVWARGQEGAAGA
ncbi:hypothetical protein T492DRAFT_902623 [Pavlovales sp. CCMP2436]|nr:hypothetical protein T492DRAFT_902623 [Pavlovales sp. CCMP2436]